MAFLLVIAGLVVLTVGAEVLVRGSVALAERLGVSPLVVGLTVVAFGTSAPELMVSLTAALSGSGGLAVGNVVGSNIANILLILGVTALIKPIPTGHRARLLQDSGQLLVVSVLFVLVLIDGTILRWQGGVMVAMLIAFVFWSYWRERNDGGEASEEAEEFEQLKSKPWWMIIGATLVGLAGVLWGADLLVTGAADLARAFGVPEEVIGLTLVAFGTSVPELATSIAAARKGHSELAIGNVLGSCLFNILAIMGITALVVPIGVPEQIVDFDVWVMIATVMVMIPFALTGARINRLEGGLFFAVYLGYVALQYFGVGAFLS